MGRPLAGFRPRGGRRVSFPATRRSGRPPLQRELWRIATAGATLVLRLDAQLGRPLEVAARDRPVTERLVHDGEVVESRRQHLSLLAIARVRLVFEDGERLSEEGKRLPQLAARVPQGAKVAEVPHGYPELAQACGQPHGHSQARHLRSEALRSAHRPTLSRGDGGCLPAGRQPHPEDGAARLTRLDADRATHGEREVLHDGETQAGAAGLA